MYEKVEHKSGDIRIKFAHFQALVRYIIVTIIVTSRFRSSTPDSQANRRRHQFLQLFIA